MLMTLTVLVLKVILDIVFHVLLSLLVILMTGEEPAHLF